jgi:hypothetical protein
MHSIGFFHTLSDGHFIQGRCKYLEKGRPLSRLYLIGGLLAYGYQHWAILDRRVHSGCFDSFGADVLAVILVVDVLKTADSEVGRYKSMEIALVRRAELTCIGIVQLDRLTAGLAHFEI